MEIGDRIKLKGIGMTVKKIKGNKILLSGCGITKYYTLEEIEEENRRYGESKTPVKRLRRHTAEEQNRIGILGT